MNRRLSVGNVPQETGEAERQELFSHARDVAAETVSRAALVA
jgi:hypothetical protein